MFEARGGRDLVTDWQNNTDDLRFLPSTGIGSYAKAMSHAVQVHGNVHFNLPDGTVVILQGAQMHQLDAGDFLF